MRLGKMTLLAAAVVSLCGLAGQARANSIDYSGGPTITPSGPNFTYTYSFVITSNNSVKVSDGFVLFDIPNLVSVGSIPSNWTSTVQLTGPYAPDTNTGATDSSLINNVFFQLTGGSDILGGSTGQSLGNFSFTVSSKLSPSAKLFGEATYENLQNDPSTQHQFNSLTLPTAVPVPAAAWMGVSTLAVAGLVGAMRKRARIA